MAWSGKGYVFGGNVLHMGLQWRQVVLENRLFLPQQICWMCSSWEPAAEDSIQRAMCKALATTIKLLKTKYTNANQIRLSRSISYGFPVSMKDIYRLPCKGHIPTRPSTTYVTPSRHAKL